MKSSKQEMTQEDWDKLELPRKRLMTLDEVMKTYPDLLTEKQIEIFKCAHEIMNKDTCAACGYTFIYG